MKYKEKSKKLEMTLIFERRKTFLDEYYNFYKWLESVGFENDSGIHGEYAYNYFSNDYLGFYAMGRPEVWRNNIFNYTTIFILDDKNHGGVFTYSYTSSEYMTLDEMKQYITNRLKLIKESINNINL